MDNVDVLILMWHQFYLKSNAGGYVRLKEFLIRIPPELNYILIDNKPSLYSSIVPSSRLVQYDSPKFIKYVFSKSFILWIILEIIFSSFILYKISSNLIKKKNIKVLYLPIGEFSNLFWTGIFLKLRFPRIKLIVDILNYGVTENLYTYYRRLKDLGNSTMRSLAIIINYTFQNYCVSKVLKYADYIFTVSPELIERIKKDYHKNSIDYTPSGVNKVKVRNPGKKKYLGVYVGRMTAEKGIFDIIKVWNLVTKKIKNAKVALVGYIPEIISQRMKKEVEDLRLTKNVIFFDQVSEEEKFKIISQSEMFLHLARYEPLFPVIGILEGLCMGLPAFVYEMPVVSSQYGDKKNRKCLFICRNGHIEDVENFFFHYLSLNRKAKEEVNKDAQAYAELFGWDKIAEKEFKIITNFVNL